MQNLAIIALALAPLALAKTDLTGCTSSVSGPSLIWYVPGTGELCEFLDCGGGRAPPKTTVPGCAAYSGTATYSPNYLPGYGPNATPTSTASYTSLGVGPVAPVPTGYGDYSSMASSAASAGYSNSRDSASASGSYVQPSSSLASSVITPTTAVSLTTPAPMYSSNIAPSISTAVLTTKIPLSSTSSSVGVSSSVAPAPSAFQGAASANSVAGGLGLVGFMAAAMALA